MTTGPKLRRDDALQAAMRMRRLGHGQTIDVMIVKDSEPDLELSLLATDSVTVPEDGVVIEMRHYLAWLIMNSAATIHKLMPLLMNQQLQLAATKEAEKSKKAYAENVYVCAEKLYAHPSQTICLEDHVMHQARDMKDSGEIANSDFARIERLVEERTPGIFTLSGGMDLDQQAER